MFDADGHIFEKSAEIFEHLDGPYKGRTNLLRSSFFPAGDDWNRTALAVAGDYKEGSNTKRGEEGAPDQWLEVLDALNLEGTVLYPTAGMTLGIIKDKPWATTLARAYNNWLDQKFLQASPRLRGMALIPTVSPVDAAEEMQRVAAEIPGMVGFFITAGVHRPLGDPFYYPIYEAAQELDIMLAIHAGGPGHRLDMMDRAIMARALGHPTSQMNQLTHMMFSGVFDRFPDVRFSFMEAGIAWAIFTMERMEEAYDQWSYEVPELTRRPAEHMTGGQLYFHCETDEGILPYAVSVLGDRQLLYASDYPHIAPDEVTVRLREMRERSDLSEETKSQILGENAKRLYKLGDSLT